MIQQSILYVTYNRHKHSFILKLHTYHEQWINLFSDLFHCLKAALPQSGKEVNVMTTLDGGLYV